MVVGFISKKLKWRFQAWPRMEIKGTTVRMMMMKLTPHSGFLGIMGDVTIMASG